MLLLLLSEEEASLPVQGERESLAQMVGVVERQMANHVALHVAHQRRSILRSLTVVHKANMLLLLLLHPEVVQVVVVHLAREAALEPVLEDGRPRNEELQALHFPIVLTFNILPPYNI